MFGRWFAPALGSALRKPYVHVLYGARQTGKSTLLRTLLPKADLWLDLSSPGERARYLASPARFIDECRALARPRGRRDAPLTVVVDEAQAVPALFDAVQHLYDEAPRRFRFVLSGSSARKLRTSGVSLLPGRSMLHRLYPLVLAERPAPFTGATGTLVPLRSRGRDTSTFPTDPLLDRLVWGDLPGVSLAPKADRGALLRAYAYAYLEEELRREALIKDWPSFARFLRLAALESGAVTNFAKIARDAGVTAPTVKSHYALLEDMFVGFRVEAFTRSARKQVLSTPRFFFFDLGVRHAAAELSNHPDTVLADPGRVFEQWVGIELWKRLQYLGRGRLTYLRTKGGLEVDYVVETGTRVIPVEVKWTDSPSRSDAKHLLAFLAERPAAASHGYVVCRCPRPSRLAENVTAIPWWAV